MRPEWDALVSSHPDASYGHSSATFDLAAVSGMQNRSLVGREGSRLIAILPLFLTEERAAFLSAANVTFGSISCRSAVPFQLSG